MISIDDILAFIERRKPGFTRTLRPIDPVTLARVEKLTPKPLPPLYREFLLRMGQDANRMQPREAWDLDPAHVVARVAQIGGMGTRFLMLGFDTAFRDPRMDLYFDREHGDRVVEINAVDEDNYILDESYDSFADFLITWTALRFLPEGVRRQLAVRHVPITDGPWMRVLADEGFTTVFATAQTLIAERGSVHVFVRHLLGADTAATFITVSGRFFDPRLSRWARMLEDCVR